MKKRRDIVSLKEITALFDEFRKTDLGLREFGIRKGLAYSTICNYRGRMIKAGLLKVSEPRLFTARHLKLIKQKKSSAITKNLLSPKELVQTCKNLQTN